MCRPDRPAAAVQPTQHRPLDVEVEIIDASKDLVKASAISLQDQKTGNRSSRKRSLLALKEWSGSFEDLDKTQQFAILAVGMFIFFGAHNVLQEAMMKVEGFTYGVMLGYMEVVGVTICSFLERKFVIKETKRVAPLRLYPLLTLCLLSSSALSNMSLNYINFPTKVVFRSCKLVPTMLIATIMNRKIFSSIEYLCAFSVCIGLIFFSVADWKLAPTFNPVGLVMVLLSVCADAVLPNAQDRLFGMGASRVEVTFFTNIFTLIAMTAMTLASGDLVAIIRHAMVDHQLALYMGVYTAVSYVAISTYMQLVKRFGGVAAVYLTTARKAMTLVLSFLLFPKEFSWFYVIGAGLVLGGLMAVSLYKQKMRKEKEVSEGAGAADQPARRRGSEGYVPLPKDDDLDLEAQPQEVTSTSLR